MRAAESVSSEEICRTFFHGGRRGETGILYRLSLDKPFGMWYIECILNTR